MTLSHNEFYLNSEFLKTFNLENIKYTNKSLIEKIQIKKNIHTSSSCIDLTPKEQKLLKSIQSKITNKSLPFLIEAFKLNNDTKKYILYDYESIGNKVEKIKI